MGRCTKCGNHPQEDLAKSGYKTRYEVQNFLFILLYLGQHTQKPNIKTTNFFPHFKTSKITSFSNYQFLVLVKFRQLKKKAGQGLFHPGLFFFVFWRNFPQKAKHSIRVITDPCEVCEVSTWFYCRIDQMLVKVFVKLKKALQWGPLK